MRPAGGFRDRHHATDERAAERTGLDIWKAGRKALPAAVPLAVKSPVVPVQDAAVPPEDDAAGFDVAGFTTLIWAVSELANPTTGEADCRVTVELVVVVCAIAPDTVIAGAISGPRNRLLSILRRCDWF